MALYDISPSAEDDWWDILNYTLDHHGQRQADKYTKNLLTCLEEMAYGKGHVKVLKMSGYDIRVKHCQKHYIFALLQGSEPMLVIAILHERMDLMKRVKSRL